MEIFFQLLFNSIIAGAMYSLVAVSFSIIYSTCRFVNFAHGSVVAIGAYALYFFYSQLHINIFISILLSITFTAVLGLLLNFFIFYPLKKKKASKAILLIVSFALVSIFESMFLLFFGADMKTIGFLTTVKGASFFGGAIITYLQIIIVFAVFLIYVFLYILMKKTLFGKSLRAVADNEEVAEIYGISSKKIYNYSFFVGSLIAGIAGVFIALEQNLSPTMGSNLIIKGFTGAVIGGIGNVYGAVFGSLMLGVAENFGVWYLPSGYKDAIAYFILIIFLLFKPNGILGFDKNIKK